jgi:hypothetical protein
MSAISLYAKASPDFSQKLAHSLALLKSSVARYSPLTQASSLGTEDMATAQRVLASYPGYGVGKYQGDAVDVQPHFKEAAAA